MMGKKVPRLWRGGDERLRRRLSWPVEFVILLEIRSSNFHRLAIRAWWAHSISQRFSMSEIGAGLLPVWVVAVSLSLQE